ncbi:hypothetical protein [Pyruvatibacter sp.]|uniref:DUF2730 family protein n=1 Tax=Pyruvatibacter sp. TaxID=1981328 RepID=UPI0032EC5F8B
MTDWIKVGLDFVALVIAVVSILFAWVRTRDASNRSEMKAIEGNIESVRSEVSVERDERRRSLENERKRRADSNGELKDRMTAVEEHVKHLPTIEHHSDLHRDLNKLEGRFDAMSAKIDANMATTRRIEDFLMPSNSEAKR